MEKKQNFTLPRYFYTIIFVVAFVTAKQLIRYYNKEALPTFEQTFDLLLISLLLFISTFKIHDIEKGTQSRLSMNSRMALFIIGIILLTLKIYLNVANVNWINNQSQLLSGLLFGIISFNYFNIICTDEKNKKWINFSKYLFGFIALGNLWAIIF
jgi:putative effector of murein hydrolase LrgA (UPF0299 family)